MKIALAQINPTVGDISGNLHRVQEAYCHAVKEGADLVVCPEMVLLGYPPKDLLERPEILERLDSALKDLEAMVCEMGLIVGTVLPSPGPGRPLINAAVLLADGRVLQTVAKSLLPTYDVFDEERYFEPATSNEAIEFKGQRLGITVCEDIWKHATEDVPHDYGRDPAAELASQGIDILINISASPYNAGKAVSRLELLSLVAQKFESPIVYVNQVGANDELIFDGRSMALNASGQVTCVLPGFEESMSIIDTKSMAEVDGSDCASSRGGSAPRDDMEEIVDALSLGIRDYLRKCGFKKGLIGLSGGIDSSVVACLAARAIGAENVWGISMPSQFNLSASYEDSKVLAENLGIRFDSLPIQDVFDSYLKTLAPVFENRPFDVAEENTQARIRGGLLMACSNKFGYIVLTTGNKSELAVGYCTLYGDMCGGLAVISDVPKCMVYEMAEWFNREEEAIPRRVIDRPPSAELRPDQKDQDSLPPYEDLDSILSAFVEEHRSRDEILQSGHDREAVDKVLRLINLNEYKRSQAAPGLRVTTKAFGFGRRMPIAKSFDVLMGR